MPRIPAPVGAAIVAALAVFATLNSYSISKAVSAQYPDAYGIARAEPRFAAALPALPPAPVLGYISDLRTDDNAGQAAFLAAQYSVAPRALAPAAQSHTEWVIGNFSRAVDFAAIGAQSGLTMVHDFGSGIILYRRTGR